MKKSVLKFFAGILLAALLSGCSWKVPQKISLKTKAEYNFNIGTFNQSLDGVLGLDSIKSALPADQGFYLYDYNPEGNKTKQFILKKNIAEVPVDFSSYMMELTSTMDPISQKISIPEIGINQSVPVNASTLSDSIGGMIKFAGPYTQTSTVNGIPEGTEIFEYFEYSSGLMTIYLGSQIGSTSCEYDAKVDLFHNDELLATGYFTELGASETKTIMGLDIPVHYKAEIDLAGKRVYMNGMKFAFYGVQFAEFFCGEVEDSSTISKAAGITVNNFSITIPDQTVPGALPDGLKSITFGDADLEATVKVPESWKNVSLDLSYEVSGGMSLSGSGKTSLAGKTLSGSDLVFKPSIKLSIKNGTIDFTQSPEVVFGLNVNKLSEITIDTAAFGLDTSFVVPDISLPSNVTDIVKKIWFGASEIVFETKSTLPEGNDIAVTCTSNLLGIADGKIDIVSGGIDKKSTITAVSQDVNGSGTTTAGAKLDFAAALTLPNANGTETTFKDLVPGTEYELSIKITPNIKWLKMALDISALGIQNLTDSIDTGFSLSSLVSSLPESQAEVIKHIGLSKLPVYLFCHVPDMDIFNSIKLNGKISFQSDEEVFLLGSATEKADLLYTGITVPELIPDENGSVSVKLEDWTSSCSADLSSIFSFSNENSIKVNYDLAISGVSGADVELTPEMVSQKGNLEVSAFLVLPLSLDVTGDQSIDILSMMNVTGDLLGRSEGFDVSAYEQYFSLISEAGIKVKADVPVGYTEDGKDIQLVIDLYKDSTDPEAPKPKVIGLKDLNVSLTSDEILYLLKNLTNPEIKIKIPEGTIAMKRDLNLSAAISVQLKTDGKIPLFEL